MSHKQKINCSKHIGGSLITNSENKNKHKVPTTYYIYLQASKVAMRREVRNKN